MYGIVNKALREMLIADHGQACWEQICRHSDLDDEIFLSTQGYPDALTYQLLAAACEITGMPATELLHRFGRYWVLETGHRSYGTLLTAGGHNLKDFLLNLPNFHARIFLIFPDLKPPEFTCAAISETCVQVRYFSHRAGLADFVLGLLSGLAELFHTEAEITQTIARQRQEDYDEFLVQWSATS